MCQLRRTGTRRIMSINSHVFVKSTLYWPKFWTYFSWYWRNDNCAGMCFGQWHFDHRHRNCAYVALWQILLWRQVSRWTVNWFGAVFSSDFFLCLICSQGTLMVVCRAAPTVMAVTPPFQSSRGWVPADFCYGHLLWPRCTVNLAYTDNGQIRIHTHTSHTEANALYFFLHAISKEPNKKKMWE